MDCVINATFSNTEKLTGMGYCRFDHVLVQADSFVPGVIQCRVPQIAAREIMVAISFDSTRFSEVQLPLKIAKEGDDEFFLRVFLVFAVVFGLGMAVYRKGQFDRRVPKNNDHQRLVSGKRGTGVL
jgi:hypothetical protein